MRAKNSAANLAIWRADTITIETCGIYVGLYNELLRKHCAIPP